KQCKLKTHNLKKINIKISMSQSIII
ncbi:hypothetical protein EC900039_3824B, partial [Escherichia coli 90.0039]